MMKTVAAFRDVYQAHLAKGRLEAEGIQAVIADENIVSINWAYSQAVGGVKVQTHKDDFEKAKEVLKDDFQEELLAAKECEGSIMDTDSCPECGSNLISPKRYSWWSLIPSFMFMLPIFFPLKKWSCDVCGAKWR